jgi:hypothetical protein
MSYSRLKNIAGLSIAAGVASLFVRGIARNTVMAEKVPSIAEQTPGNAVTLGSKALEAGANILQSFKPINSIHAYVCGIHFYNGEPSRQVIAHHYCSHLTEDFHQCVIYDSDKPDARLIGVEYIISENLYKALPDEEKNLWHSHQYEIKSGLLTAPGLPSIAEKQMMKKLCNTYGKTFHLWQVDQGDSLPLGIPQLMMAQTGDGQVDLKLLAQRDKEQGIKTMDLRKQREDIVANEVDKSANSWMTGRIIQLTRTDGVSSRPAVP